MFDALVAADVPVDAADAAGSEVATADTATDVVDADRCRLMGVGFGLTSSETKLWNQLKSIYVGYILINIGN